MDFADDVLDRLRAALMDFHAATARNGRKRSWKAIASEIHDGFLEAPELDYEDDDSLSDPDKPLAEALRRFVAGAQRPSPERLDALCQFLKSKSFLTDGDLAPGAPGAPLLYAMRQFVNGRSQKPLATSSTGIRGTLTASRRHAHGRTELSFLSISDRESDTVEIEDRVYLLPVPPQSTNREALARHIKRTGGAVLIYSGFALGWQGQVVAFVKETLYDDVSLYTVLQMSVGATKGTGAVSLVKSGDFGAVSDGHPRAKLRLLGGDAVTARDEASSIVAERLWVYSTGERA